MPVDAKPLFRPEALYPHLKTFRLPDHVKEARAGLIRWAGLIASGKG